MLYTAHLPDISSHTKRYRCDIMPTVYMISTATCGGGDSFFYI